MIYISKKSYTVIQSNRKKSPFLKAIALFLRYLIFGRELFAKKMYIDQSMVKIFWLLGIFGIFFVLTCF